VDTSADPDRQEQEKDLKHAFGASKHQK